MKINKWKIASMVLMGIGFVYDYISGVVDDRVAEDHMREIVREELAKRDGCRHD